MTKPKTAAPVFPNAGVDAWYRGRLQAVVRDMSQDMLVDVRKAWRGIDVTTDAKKPSRSLLLDKALEKWGGVWTRRIESVSREIAWDFATKNASATDVAMVSKLKDAGFAVKFKATRGAREALDATVAANVGLIKSIPQQYLVDVQTAVWNTVMGGSDLSVLTDQIQDKYGVAWRRAALIARDQNAKAKAVMEKARREEVGITSAIWQHSHAGKDPRPTHVKMDGESYEVDTGMWDSAVQKYIWPGTEINCRCTDRAVIPGFM
jgi:SPP1 gp7 family putative phage head morphogenesis protein